MTSRPQIKNATLEDLADVKALVHQLGKYDSQFDTIVDPSWAMTTDADNKLSRLINSGNGYVVLASLEGKTVGVCVGTLNDMNGANVSNGHLLMLYVSSEARRRGMGRILVRHFSNWAKGRGASIINLTAYQASKEAASFYRSIGMNPVMVEYRKSI